LTQLLAVKIALLQPKGS